MKEEPDNITELNPWPHLAGPLLVDYGAREDCKNADSYGEICMKCGACGRKFENGWLVEEKEK